MTSFLPFNWSFSILFVIIREMVSYQTVYSSIHIFCSSCFFPSNCFSDENHTLSTILSFLFFPHHFSLYRIYEFYSRQKFWQAWKIAGSRIITYVAVHGKQDNSFQNVDSAKFSSMGLGVIDSEQFKRHHHGIWLNHSPDAHPNIIRVVVIHEDSFLLRISIMFTAQQWTKSWKPYGTCPHTYFIYLTLRLLVQLGREA